MAADPTRVVPQLRFTKRRPCPICQGYDDPRLRGTGERCAGYLSRDQQYAYCTQSQYAGRLEPNHKTQPPAYAHKLYGPCKCGETHREALTPLAPRTAPARPQQRPSTRSGRIVATYDYRTAGGELVYQVLRYDPKDFRQRRPDPNRAGEWIWSIGDTARILYRLPELLAADPAKPVYIVEGEKDVHSLAAAGLVATCNAGGSSQEWLASYSKALAGRHVVILPDNDDPGRKHGEKIAKALHGVAASVRLLELPNLPDRGDVSDWLTDGGTTAELEQLAAQAPAWSPVSGIPGLISARALMLKIFPPALWIVPNLITVGLSVVSGKPKMGKSWLLLALAIARASGGIFLGKIALEQGPVLYLALEDTEEGLKERLEILLQGAEAPEQLYCVTVWPRLDAGGRELLETWLAAHPNGLVIADTLAKIQPTRRGAGNGYLEDYAAGEGLKAIADKHRAAIIAVTHNRKASAEDPLDEINATLGLAGSIDAGLVIRRERGQADAVLYATGRRIRETSLALSFDNSRCMWSLMGDAAEYAQSKERQAIYNAVRELEQATPKQVADHIGKNPNTVKNLMVSMAKANTLKANGNGTYSIVSVVSVVSAAGSRINTGSAETTPDYAPATSHSLASSSIVSQTAETTETMETMETTQTTQTMVTRNCMRCGEKMYKHPASGWYPCPNPACPSKA